MPPAKDPDVLNRLRQVYGAMPPHLTPEFKKTDRYIKQLKVRGRGTEGQKRREARVTWQSWPVDVDIDDDVDVHYIYQFLPREEAGRAFWLV